MATRSASTPAFATGDSLYGAHRRLSHRKVALLRHSHLIRAYPARRRWRIACLLPSKGLDSSWMQEEDSVGEFGGWIIVKDEDDQKKLGLSHLGRLKTVGVGASAALVLAAFFHFSLSRKGYKLHFGMRFPFPKESLTSSESTISSEREDGEKSEILPEENPVTADDAFPSTFNIEISGAKKQATVCVEADSTQRQALSVLNKLKIIEDNVKPGELCTRREYARWLVKTNSLLERNPRYKIVISGLTGSSFIPAFDDVNVDDQDFIFIQALAEVGVVPSKLSTDSEPHRSEENRTSLDHKRHDFSPESFLSRLDMVNWRTQLEYLSNPMKKEKSRR